MRIFEGDDQGAETRPDSLSPTPSQIQGDGGLAPPTSKEMVLIRKAAKARWTIPDRYRDELYAVLVKVALAPSGKSRDKIAAIRALTAMDKCNLEYLKHDADSGMEAGDYELDLDLAPEGDSA